MKTRQSAEPSSVHHQCSERSPKEDINQEQVTAINLTKNRQNKNEVELRNMQHNTTQIDRSQTHSNPGNIPYLIDEEEESHIYRIGKCQSGVHQDSLIHVKCQESIDLNNNIRQSPDTRQSPTISYQNSLSESVSQHPQLDASTVDTPTTFAGLFPQMGSQQMSVPAGQSDIDVYRQSYLEDADRYSHQQFSGRCKQQQQQQQHFVNHESQTQQLTLPVNSSSQETNYDQYAQYGHTVDDESIAAEQLASELCSTYSGSNSHMISDILKRNVGVGQNYVHGGFERPSVMESMQHFDNIVSNQHVLHDVDLLNTPQQLPAVDEACQDVYTDQREQIGDPRDSSTPDVTYQKTRGGDPVHNFQATVTYNDIHLHGGRWSSQKSPMYENQTESESPFPNARRGDIQDTRERQKSYQTEKGVYSVRTPNQQCDISPSISDRNFLDISDFNLSNKCTPVVESENRHFQESDQCSGFKSPGSYGNNYGNPQHEITKMTFTPREMMETHLSQNYKYQKKARHGQQLSEYSSIYPSREFIERATGQTKLKRESAHSQKDDPRPRKRSRVSKYSTAEVPRVPPQMPIFDSMFQKYVPLMPRDELHGGKHKYFVVNPSEITHMSSKSLITKYIDFLILENEQITEISKSTNPPVDIYVTEDMYFMDSLKCKVPFPSRKCVEWVASFYPKLKFHEMKFRGQYPQLSREHQALKPDPRPTQEILEDTFYFFQREAMNIESRRA